MCLQYLYFFSQATCHTTHPAFLRSALEWSLSYGGFSERRAALWIRALCWRQYLGPRDAAPGGPGLTHLLVDLNAVGGEGTRAALAFHMLVEPLSVDIRSVGRELHPVSETSDAKLRAN